MSAQYIPAEVTGDILQYLKPDRLHKLASYSKQARCMVNGYMNRKTYLERWDDIYEKLKNYDDVNYVVENNIAECGLEYVLNNYWYYIIKITTEDNYNKLLRIINRIKNKNLYIKIRFAYPDLQLTHSIIDISDLENIHTLYIYGAHIINLGSLTNVYKLILKCTYIPDTQVYILGNVHTLQIEGQYLDNNPKLIGYLANVYVLCIGWCNENLDIRGLTNINYLTLGYCVNISIGPSNLYINTLYLSDSDCITDTNTHNLANINNLDISYSNKLTNVSALGNVDTLLLRGCKKIGDVSMLGNVHNLDISYCSNISKKF